jgi:hypothetical protein
MTGRQEYDRQRTLDKYMIDFKDFVSYNFSADMLVLSMCLLLCTLRFLLYINYDNSSHFLYK